MKLRMLSAAAAVTLAGVSSASAQVYVADSYAAPAYPDLYAAPAPVYVAPAPVVIGTPGYVVTAPIGGYVPPKYSYTINGGYDTTYAAYRRTGTCFVDVDGFRACD
jgi:hypothetical protein